MLTISCLKYLNFSLSRVLLLPSYLYQLLGTLVSGPALQQWPGANCVGIKTEQSAGGGNKEAVKSDQTLAPATAAYPRPAT